MPPIVNDSPLKSECAVCGSPVNPFVQGLPDITGEFSGKCSKCNKTVCNDHFDASKKTCTRCEKDGTDWCETLGKMI